MMFGSGYDYRGAAGIESDYKFSRQAMCVEKERRTFCAEKSTGGRQRSQEATWCMGMDTGPEQWTSVGGVGVHQAFAKPG